MSRVSVIIPTKNRSELLMRAIRSVAEQSYTDIEIVVIDDGSTDDTAQRVKALGHEHLNYIKLESSVGGAKARNVGINACVGDYVAFLDDDDEWLPHKIELQMKFANDYKFIGTKINTIRDGNTGTPKRQPSKYNGLPSHTNIDLNDILISNCGISPSSVLMEKPTLLKIKGFDESLNANQGRDLFIRFMKEARSGVRLNEVCVNQYQNHNYGRISEGRGKRLDSIKKVHERYVGLMPNWLRQFDQARILLLEAKVSEDKSTKRKLEVQALTKLRLKGFTKFVKLYLSHFLK